MNTHPHTNRDHERREFFNERAERWLDMWYLDHDTGEHTRFDAEFDRLFSLVEVPPDGCVLDVGCGSGVLVPHVLRRLSAAGRLIEVDFAEKMIEENRRLHADERITFLTADVMKLDLDPNSIDLVLCFACFPHFEKKAEAVEALARVLKSGGKLAIAHFDSSEDLNAHHRKHEVVMHDMLPDAERMRELLRQAELETKLHLDDPGFYLMLAEHSALRHA